MTIASLKLDESVKLEFDVLVTGADGLPTARFVIEGKEFSLSYPCRQVNEGIEVSIGGLKNILPAGEYPVRLEIILDGKIYTPMQDVIKLEPVVEINTKSKATGPQLKESVKVIGKVNVTKTTVSESDRKQQEIAAKIANLLSFKTAEGLNPLHIIESSLSSVLELPRKELVSLEKLLAVAESYDINFNRALVPTLQEVKKDIKKVQIEEEVEGEEEVVVESAPKPQDMKSTLAKRLLGRF